MEITKEQLIKMMPFATKANINKYYNPLVETMENFQIDTPIRIAHFIAQLAHESGSLRYVRELASGEAYDTGKLAESLGNTPEKDGDGQKYKGRGLIQLTGRNNYKAFDEFLDGEYDLLEHPERVETPLLACMSAGWFWHTRDLNTWADKDDVVKVTKIINGGRNGLQERMDNLNRCKIVLGING